MRGVHEAKGRFALARLPTGDVARPAPGRSRTSKVQGTLLEVLLLHRLPRPYRGERGRLPALRVSLRARRSLVPALVQGRPRSVPFRARRLCPQSVSSVSSSSPVSSSATY